MENFSPVLNLFRLDSPPASEICGEHSRSASAVKRVEAAKRFVRRTENFAADNLRIIYHAAHRVFNDLRAHPCALNCNRSVAHLPRSAVRLPAYAVQVPPNAVQMPSVSVQAPAMVVHLPPVAVQLPRIVVQVPRVAVQAPRMSVHYVGFAVQVAALVVRRE